MCKFYIDIIFIIEVMSLGRESGGNPGADLIIVYRKLLKI